MIFSFVGSPKSLTWGCPLSIVYTECGIMLFRRKKKQAVIYLPDGEAINVRDNPLDVKHKDAVIYMPDGEAVVLK